MKNVKCDVEIFEAHCRKLVCDKSHGRVFEICTEAGEDSLNRYYKEVKKLGPRGIVRKAVEFFVDNGLIHCDRGSVRLPNTIEEVIEYAYLGFGGDSSWCYVSVYTLGDWKKKKEEELRARIEPMVAEICREYNVKPNSLAMISAVYKHYNSIMRSEREFRDNPEIRAERYAMCGSRESFYADNDYASTLISEASSGLEDVLSYLHKHCPLLMAKWRERKERKCDTEK